MVVAICGEKTMRLAIGNDHRGVPAKARLAERLRSLGHQVSDLGANSAESVDYPDVAAEVARSVAHGMADRGILMCSTGIGMAIAANKVPGIRAAAIDDARAAEMSRRHNNLNVLCLSADLLSESQIDQLVDIFLSAEFEGGRHARRLDKITSLEKNQSNH